MQQAQENRVVLIPEKAGQGGQSTVAGRAEARSMRGKVAPGFTLVTSGWEEGFAERLQGAAGAGELLGDVVRAVQGGDAVV